MSDIDRIKHGAYVTGAMVGQAASEMQQVEAEERGPQGVWNKAIDDLRNVIGSLQAYPERMADSKHADNHLSRARSHLDEATFIAGEQGYQFANSSNPAGRAIPEGIAALIAKHGEIARSYGPNPQYVERLGSIVSTLTGALADLEGLAGSEGPTVMYGGYNLGPQIDEYLQMSGKVEEACETYQNAL